MKLKDILQESNSEKPPMFIMGYNAFKNGILDDPNNDPNFKEHVKQFQLNFKGNIKTFGFAIGKFKQHWMAGYKQASKDSGNKPIRMKGSSMSNTKWLLGMNKRRREKQQKDSKS